MTNKFKRLERKLQDFFYLFDNVIVEVSEEGNASFRIRIPKEEDSKNFVCYTMIECMNKIVRKISGSHMVGIRVKDEEWVILGFVMGY